MLKITQELVLDKSTWKSFQEMVPEKKHYIWDCPYINRKQKVEYVVPHAPFVMDFTYDVEHTKPTSW